MMQHGPYQAQIEFDPDTDSFHGRTVNVRRGGFDFWGTSVEELRREFAASAQVFEETCREHEIPIELQQPQGVAA
jgi:predicted HicB family RNase H-like nuclease